MARSFVTRFRRQLAAIPFVIVLVVPVFVVAMMWLGHKHRLAEQSVHTTEISVSIDTCRDGDAIAIQMDGCRLPADSLSAN